MEKKIPGCEIQILQKLSGTHKVTTFPHAVSFLDTRNMFNVLMNHCAVVLVLGCPQINYGHVHSTCLRLWSCGSGGQSADPDCSTTYITARLLYSISLSFRFIMT